MTILVERDIEVPMRDGAILRADVFRSAEAGQRPVLLQRTPYGREGQQVTGSTNPLRMVEHGFTVVIQDCRGRYGSEGEFEPFVVDIEDGYDTVEWCAAQPWSNGRVGMYGMSYMGATQWLAAIASPPSLQAIMPVVSAADFHDGWVYQGGALYQAFTVGWTAEFLAVPHLQRGGVTGNEYAERQRRAMEAVGRLRRTCSHVPLIEMPLFNEIAPYAPFHDWLKRPANDAKWDTIRITDHHDRITVPALSIGGWYDLFQSGPMWNFAGLRQHAGTEEARRGQRLIMGPWPHSAGVTMAGQANFGWGARMEMEPLALRWFDRWLRDIDVEELEGAPARYFTMGCNEWRTSEEWPPPGVEYVSYYLHSRGRANGLDGDGRLSEDLPGGEPPDHYLYNPLNPTPTLGAGGAFDQRSVEGRQDVLVYTTAPFREPLDVTGSVRLELYFESSAPDTDFTGKLVEVAPNGYAKNLTENIARVRYRLEPGKESRLERGRVYKLELDLLETSNRFQPGTSLRLEVASANFPRFDRNPNTGDDATTATAFEPAVQSVYHNADYPSRLLLPVDRERS